MTVTWLVAGRTGPNAARIMSKVHDMWVNSLAALLGALAAIQSLTAYRGDGGKNKATKPPLRAEGPSAIDVPRTPQWLLIFYITEYSGRELFTNGFAGQRA